MIQLGVNIDHVATVRQARKTVEPDPVHAAVLAEMGGAHSITVHLRQDRRHIQERDVRLLRETIKGQLNLEMAVGEDVLALALEVKPQQVCLVPEKREELTTEGGLALDAQNQAMRACIEALQEAHCLVSLFIEPSTEVIDVAAALGADAVELHTGAWANAWLAAHALPSASNRAAVAQSLKQLERAAEHCAQQQLRCHAGHGITYQNVREIVHLKDLRELNIGHTIVSRALNVGMQQAVSDMRALIDAGPTTSAVSD